MINLPAAFTERMKQMLGREYDAFIASYDKERSQGLRVNGLKTDPAEFAKTAPFSLNPVAWAAEGFAYGAEDRPGRHPYHDAGVYYIQEPSAMIAASLLNPQPGEMILDLCAAPGGKSTQAAARLGGEGLLVSNEFRKDETAVTEWSPENVRRCAGRQQEILENAAMMLKPGGRLVYSTCTFAPEEDEQAIGRFLEAHPEFALEETPDYSGLSHGVPAWGAGVTDGIEKTVRIWPHRTEGEGHYAALLRKTGEPESVKRKYPASMKDKKLLAVYEDFCKEIFIEPKKWTADSTMTMFGDQLYRTPEEMVDFKGLRVLRPGLQMGEFKKNRFEPSHALALALHPSEVKQNVNLSADAPETAAYLRGETIQLSEEDAGKGWCLVSVDGYSLGWGKKSGGTLKNHYPKGLRKQY